MKCCSRNGELSWEFSMQTPKKNSIALSTPYCYYQGGGGDIKLHFTFVVIEKHRVIIASEGSFSTS